MMCPDLSESVPSEQRDRAQRFLDMHEPGNPLLLPNPWDVGSAVLLASLGFQALATTSSGFAATLGRLDSSVTREQAIAHAASIVQATELPVSADLENGFGEHAEDVAETVRQARETGLAGCSIEDFSGDQSAPIYERARAVERVLAATEQAHSGSGRFVLTARAENHVHGRDDLADTIARLQAFEQAGADVLYAPGLRTVEEIREVVESVGKPVNVLVRPGMPPVSELAAAGVARISVGGGFAFAALGALVEAAEELQRDGTYGFWERATIGAKSAREAFSE
jgi:2-methylisocitrate lyase-like PEP mutase family enzyme